MSNDEARGGALSEIERLRADVRALEAEKRHLLQRLTQADRVEAIATTAQGIAHDMNNILGNILGLASLIRFDIEPSGQIVKDVESIETTCLRGRDLMQRLMELARQRPTRQMTLQLDTIITSMKTRLRDHIADDSELSLDLGEATLELAGDIAQLEQVIVCLCLNASEALRSNGRILVSTSPVTLEKKDVMGAPWLEPGPYVRLIVSDNGEGMDRSTLGEACKPFFSTRKGHDGLGLTLVYWVTRNHNGRMTIESTPGEGTQVFIDLPR